MKFSVSSKALKEAAKTVKPIFGMSVDSSVYKNHICLVAEESKLSLLASNGITKYQSSMSIKGEAAGSIVVAYDKLSTAVDAIKADTEVLVELKEKILYIKVGKKEIELKTISPKNYSLIEVSGPPITMEFESTSVFSLVEKTMCREKHITRMYGLVLQFLEEADGKKLCELKTTNGTGATKVVEPYSCVEVLSNPRVILPEFLVDECVKRPLQSMNVTSNWIFAQFPDLLIQTPLPQDNFVNVDAVLNSSAGGKEISFKKDELLEAVKFVKATSDKHDLKIKFTINKESALISSYSELAKAKDTIDCIAEEPIIFTVNSENMLRLLDVVQDENISIQVAEKIVSYTKDNYKFVTVSFSKGA